MEIRSILFPTDFSEGSSQALQYAADIARRYGAKLYLLYVVHEIVEAGGWYVPHPSMDNIYKDLVRDAQKELDEYGLEELKGLNGIERRVLRGVPHEVIVKFASDNRIDLIIIGTHGRKGIDRILFGSTAAYVVRHAPCPVLTVRLPKY
ncbi:MAG: universal stress protein [Nitrospirae bacterium CG_4_10_14_0_8_um_filter_41_23]|nr:universal stress protein [Nitrospirota bacterium]PIQ93306.1 MAG: universal stress protein [Nitrospirae bacterium CG11_big_fil_rev_8_21_14_0_20_41_14]PIV41050.1 MAG: universal stress protein [Nitrospirae bacterium CG02_land_8_20_14_3_00_41_53]PIW87435.1 MAG: universal stress protein [Nitrospirae bacterium CG_4_8_14_3_um_filter_41_47]PIY86413.1 MAG: universal stress protein [Nitrospirae bacterium CG_4_10_14_0_8_um_filter_41_23]PJA80632.1 MAG: universal stress protein [Nitrospirae bacterium CG